MENPDVRWKQRFSNFERALKKLTEIVELSEKGLTDIEKEGLIQRFEFTHELSWNVMRDYLIYEGIQNITGSRTATREAFNKDLINDGQVWMEMIESRNRTSHTYIDSILETEFKKIVEIYFSEFKKFESKIKSLL